MLRQIGKPTPVGSAQTAQCAKADLSLGTYADWAVYARQTGLELSSADVVQLIDSVAIMAIGIGAVIGLVLGIAVSLATGLPLAPEGGLVLGGLLGWLWGRRAERR